MNGKKGLNERKEAVIAVARTTYLSLDDAAVKYIDCIVGAGITDQYILFEMVISLHDALSRAPAVKVIKNSIPFDKWIKAVDILRGMVNSWIGEGMRRNESLPDTAKMLWDHLSLREGTNRAVALGLLLGSKLVPYAMIPPMFAQQDLLSVYLEAELAIVTQIGLFSRLITQPDLTGGELSAVVVDCLGSIPTCEGKNAFLRHVLRRMSSPAPNPRQNLIDALHSLGLGITFPQPNNRCADDDPIEDES